MASNKANHSLAILLLSVEMLLVQRITKCFFFRVLVLIAKKEKIKVVMFLSHLLPGAELRVLQPDWMMAV